MKRPSYKECNKRLQEARQAVADGNCEVENPLALVEDLDELGYLALDLKKLLPDLLDEIGPQHYAGQRPPATSYKSRIIGAELWAFAWESNILGCRVYFKFAFKQGKIWIVSLHKDRP